MCSCHCCLNPTPFLGNPSVQPLPCRGCKSSVWLRCGRLTIRGGFVLNVLANWTMTAAHTSQCNRLNPFSRVALDGMGKANGVMGWLQDGSKLITGRAKNELRMSNLWSSSKRSIGDCWSMTDGKRGCVLDSENTTKINALMPQRNMKVCSSPQK